MSRPIAAVVAVLLLVVGVIAGRPAAATTGPAAVTNMSAHVGRPAISRLSVASGPIAGGTRVTLTGHHLVSVRTVRFGASTARIVSRRAPSAVTVLAPRHTSGAVVVRVSTAYGRSHLGPRFTYALRPSVSSLPTFVSQVGGRVSIDGAHLDAVRRISVDGHSAKVLKSAGSGSGQRVEFAAPAHAPGLVPVHITTAGGTVTTRLLYESSKRGGVTQARPIDEYQGQIVGLSCPSTTFCLAIDDANAVTFNGANWSRPAPVGRSQLFDVSCASATFCVALGNLGGAIFDGSRWTLASPGIVEPRSISCPAPGQCVAVGVSGTAVLQDGSWHQLSSRPLLDRGDISCLRLAFCLAVDGAVQYAFDGSTWTPSTVATSDGTTPRTLMDVSCSAEVDCTAIDLYGSVWRYQDGDWSVTRSLAPSDYGRREIACGSADFCVVSDDLSTAVTSASTAAASTLSFDLPYFVHQAPRLRVSCPTATFCVAASYWGAFSQWDGTTWSTPDDVLAPVGALTSIACAAPTECFAADEDGTVVPYNGGSWSPAVRVDPWRIGRTIVSCASSGLCATISQHGDLPGDVSDGTAAVLLNGSWHATRGVLSNAIAISCGGSRCMAVSARQYSTYDSAASSPAWSAPAALPAAGASSPGGDAVSVACTTSADCVVAFGTGYSRFAGHAWSAVRPISHGVPTGLVGCASAGMCLARNSGFSMLRAPNGRWGSPVRTADRSPAGDIAETCGGPTCLSLTGTGFQLYRGKVWTVEQHLPEQFFYPVGASCMPNGTCLIVRSDGTGYRVTP